MSALFGIAIIHFFALISPGPDFFFVTQSAIRQSRTHALFAAFGISLSILVWSICALSGLHFLFQKMAWLQQVLMILGGIYLLYLGVLMLKSVLNPPQPDSNIGLQSNESHVASSHLKLLFQGFLTNMANPKALVYFSSVFAVAINTNTPLSEQGSLLLLIFLESLLWFTLVAFIFSMQRINQGYQKFSKWIDGITGGIFISFGLLLILNRD
ncbi:threonine export protein RhtC [Acinetobacter wanghuae]|uniref:Threonine export protein RhtC n=1 Tax=Acinetobacter wanghuae TaxID=2662362 RepID=A0A5Q0P265_9GAMM|nr:LysE family transporter [Acinetobacter wanghuae]MQW91519.1 threonine export protein RhtC [Acinetobacter wanghuae]QGA10874.1 threonine export protein RhtC [Acinetobacter wanghuae]